VLDNSIPTTIWILIKRVNISESSENDYILYMEKQNFMLNIFTTLYLLFCDVRYDFRIKTMFGSSLPPVVCMRAHVLLGYSICVCLRIAVYNTYCVMFLFWFSSTCVPYVASSPGLSFLIAPSVFSNVYL
jgi:hypothetical protein